MQCKSVLLLYFFSNNVILSIYYLITYYFSLIVIFFLHKYYPFKNFCFVKIQQYNYYLSKD